MKALVLEEYGKFVLEDVEKPTPTGNEVLIKVMACSVCGSDVHGMDGSTGRRKPPIIMGHEASGIIVGLGPDVKEYKEGDRVTFDSTIYCNECDMCKAGKVNLCKNRKVLGVSCDEYKMNGAFAEYVVIPEHVLYRLPDSVTYQQAAMVEPLSVAYHGMTRTQVKAGDTVMIVGIGTIGILALQIAKSMGAGKLIAVDVDDVRLQMASENGADLCVNSRKEGALSEILSGTMDGDGVDVAVDCTGIQATFDLCLDASKLDGKVVLIGNVAPNIDMRLQTVVTHQLSLFGSCASAGEYPDCLRLIAEGKVRVEPMISASVGLEEGNEYIHKLYNREPGYYKVVLLPNGEEE